MKNTAPLLVMFLALGCGNVTEAPLRVQPDAHDAGGPAGDSSAEAAATDAVVGSPGDVAGGELGQADAGAPPPDAVPEAPAPVWPPPNCEFHPTQVMDCPGNTHEQGLPCYVCTIGGVRMPAAGGAPCVQGGDQGNGVCAASCGGACE